MKSGTLPGVGSEHRLVVAADPASPGSIHRAVAAIVGSGTVFLGPGEHVVDSTIELPSGVSLVGTGAASTTITLAPGSSCHVFTNNDHAKGNEAIELRGFTLEGNMRTQPRPADLQGITFACGGYFKRVKHLVVQDVVARGIRQTAFHFNHCKHVMIERLEADELGWSGVSTSGTDDIVLRSVVVTNSGLDVRHSGMHLDGGTGAYVDAAIDTCTDNGIMLDSKFSPLSDVVVCGVVRRSMRGLSLSGNHEKALSKVHVSGDFSDNREVGVLVSNASNVFIVGTTTASNGSAGIVIQGRSGSPHCVVASSHITGSPDLVVERDGNHVAYVTETVEIPTLAPVEPLATSPATAANPGVPDDDSFDGIYSVGGTHQAFIRRNASLREGCRCVPCKASLRYRGQAGAILRSYAHHGATTIAELVHEPEFAALSFWEPRVLGPFRQHFTTMPSYVMSDYWPDVAPGDTRDGVRGEDLMALTFADNSYDLVVTSDIFEHVRHPCDGFAEVRCVLRPGGRHIFSIPVQEPWRAVTVAPVDISGADDVNILEPRYHLGPGNSQHIVFNDFGRDLVDGLATVGFDRTVIRFESSSAEASRLLTFCCTKRRCASRRRLTRCWRNKATSPPGLRCALPQP